MGGVRSLREGRWPRDRAHGLPDSPLTVRGPPEPPLASHASAGGRSSHDGEPRSPRAPPRSRSPHVLVAGGRNRARLARLGGRSLARTGCCSRTQLRRRWSRPLILALRQVLPLPRQSLIWENGFVLWRQGAETALGWTLHEPGGDDRGERGVS
ncbi:hypothetical protein PAHAL_9G300000 [Panicum hallii]|uniref:Uncharacterized protein n=1 Tax=Panicum hallii TaxID=206008 RepID=A0A2T8I2Y9_9POAL|nr:hypothetical protein PAHAL_9G300000 [Panicum hallii]